MPASRRLLLSGGDEREHTQRPHTKDNTYPQAVDLSRAAVCVHVVELDEERGHLLVCSVEQIIDVPDALGVEELAPRERGRSVREDRDRSQE